MLHRLKGSNLFQRINPNQSPDKFNKKLIIGPDSILEGGLFGYINMIEPLALGIPCLVPFFVEVDEVLVAEEVDDVLATLQHPLRPWAQNALDPSDHAPNMMVEE